MPQWPPPEDPLCPPGTDELVDEGVIVIYDDTTGRTGEVGINPGMDPNVYMSLYALPGATAAWAQDIWDAFLARGTPYTTARLIWWGTALTNLAFSAAHVYPNKPGGYPYTSGLNMTIAVAYCPPTP